jgi:hypothetical protein
MTPTPGEHPDELAAILKSWQMAETAAIERATEVIERTGHPVIRLAMEIIRRDSEMHRRVQQAILDGPERQAFTEEELREIWNLVEQQSAAEKRRLEFARQAAGACRTDLERMPLTYLLLTYVVEDEKKRARLLGHLENFQHNQYEDV